MDRCWGFAADRCPAPPEQTWLLTTLHHRGYRNTFVYFLSKSTRAIKLKTKAIWKCSLGLATLYKRSSERHNTAASGGFPCPLSYFLLCASCWNRQPAFRLMHLQTPQDNKLYCLDWSPVWYLTLLQAFLLYKTFTPSTKNSKHFTAVIIVFV